jgi:hypothetical protein
MIIRKIDLEQRKEGVVIKVKINEKKMKGKKKMKRLNQLTGQKS